MHSAFEEKKARIIAQLNVSPGEYHDLSPKGSIDANIRDLIDEINGEPNLVTTSSCAGRLSVYVEAHQVATDAQVTSDVIAATRSGSKGGGRWLFVSHDPVVPNAPLSKIFGFSHITNEILSGLLTKVSLIHLKFEAMILHILTASLDDASKVLIAANTSGFRESGATGLSNNQDGSCTPMVAVRSNGLSYDAIIGFIDEEGQAICIVPEEHLVLLNNIATERFSTNIDRIARFRGNLLRLYSHRNHEGIEDAAAKRARKKAEGLARQTALRGVRSSNEEVPNGLLS